MNEPNNPTVPKHEQSDGQTSELPKVICARELFAGEREICIEHAGEMYRLRITRRNKLILQK